MIRNQIPLYGHKGRLKNLGFSLSQNKNFLRDLYVSEDFDDAKKWFDKLDCAVSWNRTVEAGMNLEKFLSLMNSRSGISSLIKLGSPHEFEISYCTIIDVSSSSSKFSWLSCLYNEKNYSIISGLFFKNFNKKMEEIEAPEYLRAHHKQMCYQ